jgi:hypothetical protein
VSTCGYAGSLVSTMANAFCAFVIGSGKGRDREGAIASTRAACAPRDLQQLIWINVDRDGHVFGEGQFVDGLTHKAAQANDGFAADQNVETELAL